LFKIVSQHISFLQGAFSELSERERVWATDLESILKDRNPLIQRFQQLRGQPPETRIILEYRQDEREIAAVIQSGVNNDQVL